MAGWVGRAAAVGVAIGFALSELSAAWAGATAADIRRAKAFVSSTVRQFGAGDCVVNGVTETISSGFRFPAGRVVVTRHVVEPGQLPRSSSYDIPSKGVQLWLYGDLGPCTGEGKRIALRCPRGSLCIRVMSGGRQLTSVEGVEIPIYDAKRASRVLGALSVIYDPTCWSDLGCKY